MTVPASLSSNLKLLQLSVRQREGRQTKILAAGSDAKAPSHHAASQRLRIGDERLRRSEGTQAGRKICQRLLAEIGVRIRRDERPIDPSVLEILEDRSRLRVRLLRLAICSAE